MAKSKAKVIPAPAKVKKPVKLGIGKLAKELIMKGYTFQQTLDGVKKEFPETGFSKKCYYWYRHHLAKDDNITPPAIRQPKSEAKAKKEKGE